jgi:hypothetical protein
MRTSLALALIALGAACQRTPEQRHDDQLRTDAHQQSAAIENQADTEAHRLEQQADDLYNQSNQAGGYTGQRLKVRADALGKEAKIVRKQAEMQADAVTEAADARIKATQSR